MVAHPTTFPLATHIVVTPKIEAKFGQLACAIRGDLALTALQAIYILAMSGKISAKKSAFNRLGALG